MKPGLGLTVSLGLKQELRLQPVQILRNELLVLPIQDLEARIQAELDENICLEAEEQQEPALLLKTPEPSEQMTPPGGDEDPEAARAEKLTDPGQLSELLNYLKSSRSTVARSGGDTPEPYDLEARVSLPKSWRQDLQEAVRLERLSEEEEAIAEYIVGSLDERGYFTESLEEVASEFGCAPSLVEQVLTVVQKVAPAGIGARDLRESLLLRCRADPDHCREVERMIEEGFDDLLHVRFERLQRKLGWSREQLAETLGLLRNLMRNSDLLEEGEPPSEVIPDATVYKTDEGWKVSLRDERVPRLRLTAYASNLTKEANSLSPDAKEYLQRAFNRAKWIMQALDQRRQTLRRIVEAVVERQKQWLEDPATPMVPLRQEDVAEQLNLHPATISRAVQDKYVETPHGVFPLKSFFPRGVPSHSGGQQAREAVQERLKALIENEDPDRPYSDDALVELLAEANINISRRTVCKYRDELGIAPASRRKGLYKLFKPQAGR